MTDVEIDKGYPASEERNKNDIVKPNAKIYQEDDENDKEESMRRYHDEKQDEESTKIGNITNDRKDKMTKKNSQLTRF